MQSSLPQRCCFGVVSGLSCDLLSSAVTPRFSCHLPHFLSCFYFVWMVCVRACMRACVRACIHVGMQMDTRMRGSGNQKMTIGTPPQSTHPTLDIKSGSSLAGQELTRDLLTSTSQVLELRVLSVHLAEAGS